MSVDTSLMMTGHVPSHTLSCTISGAVFHLDHQVV